MKRIDLNTGFENYFHEIESFATRSERFYDDVDRICNRSKDNIDYKILESWLHSAYLAGARAMAQDSINTLKNLSDEIESYSDIETSDIKTYNTTEAFEMVKICLLTYYTKILEDVE